MSYCTSQDMQDRYGTEELIQLTDRPDPETRAYSGVINTAALGLAIADASAEIDGFLAGRYSTPLDPVPAAIVRYACDMARYYLYADQPTENVRKRYEDARSYLLKMSKGEIGLRDSDVQAQPVSNGARMQSGGRVFGRDSNGFI